MDAESTIVVGVDGSTASARALGWAADRARLVGAGLQVVMAWRSSDAEEWPAQRREVGDEGLESRIMLRSMLAQVLGESPDVAVSSKAIEGPASRVLLDEAAGASLLVLGDRGIGGFAGLRLGSVGLQCAMEAPCTVIIVRDGHGESWGTHRPPTPLDATATS